MKKDRVRINPQSMAKDMAYVKRKLKDILTNDDMPVNISISSEITRKIYLIEQKD